MKTILVTQRVDMIESYGERRDALDQNWVKFLALAECVALPVPNNETALKHIINTVRFDGILLSGGNSSTEYGGNAPERDATDELLIKYAEENHIPLIGVCRGFQSLITHYGGRLTKIKGHAGTRHKATTSDGKSFTVNSYHNLALLMENLPECLEATITATNETKSGGVISVEGACLNTLPFIGIMFHPEREKCNDGFDSGLISIFKKHYSV